MRGSPPSETCRGSRGGTHAPRRTSLPAIARDIPPQPRLSFALFLPPNPPRSVSFLIPTTSSTAAGTGSVAIPYRQKGHKIAKSRRSTRIGTPKGAMCCTIKRHSRRDVLAGQAARPHRWHNGKPRVSACPSENPTQAVLPPFFEGGASFPAQTCPCSQRPAPRAVGGRFQNMIHGRRIRHTISSAPCESQHTLVSEATPACKSV